MGMDYDKGKKYSSLDISILNPIASNIIDIVVPFLGLTQIILFSFFLKLSN
jgi:hypothetical protein